jgi:uncharacterized protein (TIGR03083 family)
MASTPELPLPERIGRYDRALADFVALARSLEPGDWGRPTDLPGWSVQDNVSHVVGVESDLLGRPAPAHTPDWAALPHVRGDMGRFVEVAVDARRGSAPDAVLAELVEVVEQRRAALAAAVGDPVGPAPGFFGTVDRMLGLRPFDIWAHEQDIRRAVGRPGNLDGAGALAARDRLRLALPYVVGQVVGAPPGTVVRWEVAGPLAFSATVTVGDDGRAVDVGDRTGAAPDVRLEMGWETFVLLGCGRRPPAAVDVVVRGDAELGTQVLAAMPVTP